MITAAQIMTILPLAKPKDVQAYYGPLAQRMGVYEITTPLRMAHFIAQVGWESGQLHYPEELGSGQEYEGRIDLGNTQPGDGPLFKGRGLIQLTGRINYELYGRDMNRNFTANLMAAQQVAVDPTYCTGTATWFWHRHHLNDYADRDNLAIVTKIINGGQNGYAGRAQLLLRAKKVLGVK